MDPADRLELAADRLEAALARGELPDFLREREVFIDEFDTFNAPKNAADGRDAGGAAHRHGGPVRRRCAHGAGDMGLFSGAKQVAAQLRQLARKNGADAAVPELLRRDLRHKDAPGLAAVTELLETGTCEVPPAAPEVRLFAAASREEEARCTAAAIRRLMRQGVRCGKMAVVCRNIPDYRAAIRYEFRMADIPLYCDEPTTPEFSAPATAVRALLALLRGADMTENLTILAKTGLCALTEPQVCALENLCLYLVTQCGGMAHKFEKSPKGFGENELSDEDAKTLEDAETARQLLVTAVDELRSKVRGGSAEQISRELYFCLKNAGCRRAAGQRWWKPSALPGASRRQRKRPASGTW